MPFNLELFKERLQKYVIENHILAALNLCKEQLKQGTEKHRDVLLLLSRFTWLEKEWYKGLIKIDDYERSLNLIVSSFIDLYQSVEFNEIRQSKLKPFQKGTVLYSMPNEMLLKQPNICTIRIANERNQSKIPSSQLIKKQEIIIADHMIVELIDSNGEIFNIEEIYGKKAQEIPDNDFQEWLFEVTPLKEGTYQLLIKVSISELDLRTKEYVPKDLSFLEKITVVTKEHYDGNYIEPALKKADENLVFGMPRQSGSTITIATLLWENKYVRTIAYTLTVLLLSTGLYALYKSINNSWWWTRLINKPLVYQKYIDENNEMIQSKDSYLRIEEAFFRKAEVSNRLEDWQKYLNLYPHGTYKNQVLKKTRQLEWEMVSRIQKEPSVLKILKYFNDFPSATHITQIIRVIKTLPDSQQAIILPHAKEAYIQTIKIEPNIYKLDQYSMDFPDLPGLDRITELLKMKGQPLEIQIKIDQLNKKNPPINSINESDLPLVENGKKNKFKQINAQNAATELFFKAEKKADSLIWQARDESISVLRKAKRDSAEIVNRAREIRDSLLRNNDPFFEQMISIKGGAFLMGNRGAEFDSDNAQRTVTVSSFLLSKYEVTQQQWRQIMGKDPDSLHFKECNECPVEMVSWKEVQVFISKINKITGKSYRLPTEEEWEYAAKGGEKRDTFQFSGYNTIDSVAWYEKNSGLKTHPVGVKHPNGLGLYDMSGNVSEWCQDWYNKDPLNQSFQVNRVTRGGSWRQSSDFCRVSFRNYGLKERNYIGFRLAHPL